MGLGGWALYRSLRQHRQLAIKRHPMYDTSRYARGWMMILALFGIGYLFFFGTFFGFLLQEGFSREPYMVIDRGLVFFLILDFLLRLPLQSTPSQQVKPYLLLPLRRGRLIDFLLIRSGQDGFNLLWMAFFLPFALLTVTRFYGLWGVLTYLVGLWLLFVANGYWYLLCRSLSRRHALWWLLPIGVTAVVLATLFVPGKAVVMDLSMELGEGWIHGQVWAFALMLAVIAALWAVCRKVVGQEVYRELGRVDSGTAARVRHTARYRWLDRYGLVGEYMRLELRMLWRNKVCRVSLATVGGLALMFCLLVSFTDVYSNTMSSCLLIYDFVIFALLLLEPVMCYEGNYIDGLMMRPGSILTLLRAKYATYAAFELIPALLTFPAVLTGHLRVLMWLGLMLFVQGPVCCCLFQLAVYNRHTVSLTTRVAQFNVGSGVQSLLAAVVLIVSAAVVFGLQALVGQAAADWTLIALGLAFILASRLWLRNIYKRFMQRRYANMEGFRASREK